MRAIQQIHRAVYEPIGHFSTWRALPTASVRYLDPFILLNHHGPQDFPPGNSGLPFGPHPHRGFETLTYILEGELSHRDSSSGASTIYAGGIQWMTAGSGLVHAEESSDEFRQHGGRVEVLQLWMNLPARLKMTPPTYQGFQADAIPVIVSDAGKAKLHLISGEWQGQRGPVTSLTQLFTSWVTVEAGGRWEAEVPPGQTIFFYVISGELEVNGTAAAEHALVAFEEAGNKVAVIAQTDVRFMFNYGQPLAEPVVSYGPFVMNTQAEIQEAIQDYQRGKLGTL